MKKFIALVLSLVMALSLCVPAWGATTITVGTSGDKATLAEAVAAAVDGDTIKLQNTIEISGDLEITKNVTIDTTGIGDAITVKNCTLTLGENVKFTSDTTGIVVSDGGKLIVNGARIWGTGGSGWTIMDVNGAGAVLDVNTGSTIYREDGSTIGVHKGILNINGGTVYNTGNVGTTLFAYAGGVINVFDGEVYSEANSAVSVKGGKLYVNGGTVSSDAVSPSFCAAFSWNGGEIHVEGGSVLNTNLANPSAALIAAKTSGTTGGKVYVTSGTVGSVLAHEAADASATITGGTITGSVAAKNGATASITGGTFDVEPDAKFIPMGYDAIEDGGKYVVKQIFTISFDKNGGTGEMESITLVAGGEYQLPEPDLDTVPAFGFTAPKGMQFKGWSEKADGSAMVTTPYLIEKGVTLYAIWEKIAPPVADETVDAEVKVEDVKSSEITLNEGFTQDDIDNATEAEISTEFAITVASPTDIPADVQAELSDADDVVCLDIDLHLYIDGDHAGNITKLDNVVEVRIPASVLDDFAPVANGYTRTYYVVHHHDTVVEVLPAEVDGDDLVIYSDKFSPYYVAYEDTPVYYGWGGGYVGGTTTTTEDKPIESPKTFDAGVALYVGMSVAAAVGTVTLSKKRED